MKRLVLAGALLTGVAAMLMAVFSMLGSGTTQTAQASTPCPGLTDVGPAMCVSDASASVGSNATVTLSLYNAPAAGSKGYTFDMLYPAGLTLIPGVGGGPAPGAGNTTDACHTGMGGVPPNVVPASGIGPADYSAGCIVLGAGPVHMEYSSAAGALMATVVLQCTSIGPKTLNLASSLSAGYYDSLGALTPIAATNVHNGTVTCTAILPTNTPAPTATNTPLPALAIFKSPDKANLWICDGMVTATPTILVPACPAPGAVGFVNGQGALVLTEKLINGSGVGLGAFEFQIKFDHKLFAIDGTNVFDAGCVRQAPWPPTPQVPPYNPCVDPINPPPPTGPTFLGKTNRIVFCTTTTLLPVAQSNTENFINFGCVSAGYTLLGQPIPGPTGNGDLAELVIALQGDVAGRIRPGAKNGQVRLILDENCEAVDVLGVPLPGSIMGGLTPQCGDASVTVRRLEGDVNGDCKVNITDGAIMASRFGAFYGSLAYDPFYDVWPTLTDFSINIKDLQFVAGRVFSTCGSPLPTGSQLPVTGLSVGVPAS